jgi:hypothetical protein
MDLVKRYDYYIPVITTLNIHIIKDDKCVGYVYEHGTQVAKITSDSVEETRKTAEEWIKENYVMPH